MSANSKKPNKGSKPVPRCTSQWTVTPAQLETLSKDDVIRINGLT
jgi:hypothetical protein